ncbi:MAG: hypothetical protein ABIR62_09210 [Dokdonella sp.]|uniref:HzsA-related protein n=1 Tax=Dokdonella sp. TaxID=2291710 RepID=UPI003265449E
MSSKTVECQAFVRAMREMVVAMIVASGVLVSSEASSALANPILFVTQVPVPADFASIGSVFANHLGNVETAARGGDLWIRYANGTLRNLTQEAGYGNAGQQGANAIAVRDPAVSFDGTRAVFSMVIGAPTAQYQQGVWYWQMYEVSGFGPGQTVVITRVANQPSDSNNVEPVYASDGSLIFASDRPRNGQRHLYPQLDEYESAPTTTGLWKLSAGGALTILQHSPSGSFGPLVDSYGRLLVTRWDHLQTDQQAAADADAEGAGQASIYGTFDYVSEAANATRVPRGPEVYPEPLFATAGSNLSGHRFNFFFPWQLNQDGTTEETLNHVGRHELQAYFERSITNDPALDDFIDEVSGRPNVNPVENLLQLAEDPTHPGRYYAIDAPEFYTHASGQLVSIDAAPTSNPAELLIDYHAPRSAAATFDASPAGFAGRYRNPLPLADGQMVAAYTDQWAAAYNAGTRPNPVSNYTFRLQRVTFAGGQATPAEALTAGISKSVAYWDPDVLVSYNGPMWELSPVEVRSHAVPPNTAVAALSAPEIAAFAAAGVDPDAFRAFLKARGLGVLVSRNVTSRDAADRQQPYNLRVPGGTQTVGSGGQLYDIAWMQFFEGDQVRGMGGTSTPDDGRRVLARPLHDADAFTFMPPTSGAPPGSVAIAADGSTAVIVPARRAMTWQTTSPTGEGVVRERYWLNVQPGEVRACDGCHGVNHTNQAAMPPAQNTPAALVSLLEWWRDHSDDVFGNGFD